MLGIGERRFAQREMRQFMGDGEHLRGLRISAVDEDERRMRMRQRKPRNSSGSSFRCVLLPTTPLTMIRTPSSSTD